MSRYHSFAAYRDSAPLAASEIDGDVSHFRFGELHRVLLPLGFHDDVHRNGSLAEAH
jgi:hypothetical protein